MSRPSSIRAALVLLGLLVLPGATARAQVPQACDPTGRWAFKIEWSSGDCSDLPDDNGVLIIVRGDDGLPMLADSEDGAGALDRHVNVRVEDGGCRIKLDFNVNQTAYGAPDLARWTYSLIDSSGRGGQVQGSGTYTHDESAKKGKRCTQRFAATGARAARSESAAPTGPVITQPTTTTTTPTTTGARPAAAPAIPAASACSDGKSVTSDTAGRCCWSGQAWAGLRSRCVGIPTSCPEGRHVEGEECAAGSEAERISMMLTREVGARRGAVEACWKRTFPDGVGPKGFLRMRLSVRRSGQVREAAVIEDTLHANAVSLCAVDVVTGWALPSTGVDEVLFEYPFSFGPPAAPAK